MFCAILCMRTLSSFPFWKVFENTAFRLPCSNALALSSNLLKKVFLSKPASFYFCFCKYSCTLISLRFSQFCPGVLGACANAPEVYRDSLECFLKCYFELARLSVIIWVLRGGMLALSPCYTGKKPPPPLLINCKALPSASNSRPIERSGDCDYILPLTCCYKMISCVRELLLGCKCKIAELVASCLLGPEFKNGKCTLSAVSIGATLLPAAGPTADPDKTWCYVRKELEVALASITLFELNYLSVPLKREESASVLATLASALF